MQAVWGESFHSPLCFGWEKAKDSEETGLNEKSSNNNESLKTKSTKNKNKSKTFTTNGIALVEALRNHTGEDQILLPTFTCVLESDDDKEMVRVLTLPLRY